LLCAQVKGRLGDQLLQALPARITIPKSASDLRVA
jgi:hypothetical protein